MNNEYFTFAGRAEAFLTEKKSRFISAGAEVSTESEAADFVDEQKGLYKEASHYVFAYRLADTERASDAGEPSGTAGAPILNLLKAEGMRNAIIVVTRYFGGILLGKGGLTHAYGNCAKLLLETGKVIKKVRCRKISLAADYVFLGKLQYFIGRSDVFPTRTDYTGRVDLELIARDEAVKEFIREVADLTNGRAETRVSEAFYHEYPFSQRA
ncbi:MAG: YigZ family protein [Clostridiales bacterium]|nr:YigZ family protein [Clostridiales bacterium]